MACALDGLTVLDLSTGPAAALATMFLGDHGARVVRLVATRSAAPARGRLHRVGPRQGVRDARPRCWRWTASIHPAPPEAARRRQSSARLVAGPTSSSRTLHPARPCSASWIGRGCKRVNPRLVAARSPPMASAGPGRTSRRSMILCWRARASSRACQGSGPRRCTSCTPCRAWGPLSSPRPALPLRCSRAKRQAGDARSRPR